jgi:hypothetical protein
MPFKLIRRPVRTPEVIAVFDAGTLLELVEMDFGVISDINQERLAGPDFARAVLAETLQVNGERIGRQGLRELPGHLLIPLSELAIEAMEIHGMQRLPALPKAGPEDEDEDADEPPIAHPRPNGSASPGEAQARSNA